MLLFKPAFWLLFQWLPIKCLVTRISLDLWPKRTKCRYNCAESWYQIFCHADDFISPGSLKLGDSSATMGLMLALHLTFRFSIRMWPFQSAWRADDHLVKTNGNLKPQNEKAGLCPASHSILANWRLFHASKVCTSWFIQSASCHRVLAIKRRQYEVGYTGSQPNYWSRIVVMHVALPSVVVMTLAAERFRPLIVKLIVRLRNSSMSHPKPGL